MRTCRLRRLRSSKSGELTLCPQIDLASRGELRNHRLGKRGGTLSSRRSCARNKSSIERDAAIVGADPPEDGRLHGGCLGGWRLGNARRLHAAADRGCTCHTVGGAEKASRESCLLLAQRAPASLGDTARLSCLFADLPRRDGIEVHGCHQKSRFASIARDRRCKALARLGKHETRRSTSRCSEAAFLGDDLRSGRLALIMARYVVGGAIDAVGIACL